MEQRAGWEHQVELLGTQDAYIKGWWAKPSEHRLSFLTSFSLFLLTFLTLGAVLRYMVTERDREWNGLCRQKLFNSAYPTAYPPLGRIIVPCLMVEKEIRAAKWEVFLPHSKNHHTHCFIPFSNIFSNAVWVPALVFCRSLRIHL